MCNIQNEYLTAECQDKTWTVEGPEFCPEQGKLMLVVRENVLTAVVWISFYGFT